MTDLIENNKIEDVKLERCRIEQELAVLFGEDIVNQAGLIDVIDLNLNDDMTGCISRAVNQLKKMKDQPESQKDIIGKMSTGERLVVCMWIMEMGLLPKLQTQTYVSK